MKHHLLALATAVAATFATTAVTTATAATAATNGRGFTVEDLVSMERIGTPVVSPDGSRVVYTVRSTDMAKNKGHTDLYLVDLRAAKPAPQRLTSDAASSTDPEWSASGDAIYFLSARSGSSQVWRVSPEGGEAVQVTNTPVDVDAYRISPTGDRI